jgi:hypothetical protein
MRVGQAMGTTINHWLNPEGEGDWLTSNFSPHIAKNSGQTM